MIKIRKNLNINLNHFAFVFAAMVAAGCWSASAVFNQRAYEQSVSLKVDALVLVDEATLPYDSCRTEIDAVKLEFRKAYEYVKGLPDNDETIKQYEIMMDTTRSSLFGFLVRWKSKGKLSAVFVQDAEKIISDQFDEVIGLESGKRKE